MPVVDQSQFARELSSPKSFPSVAVLMGDDETLLQDSLKTLRAEFLKRFGDQFPEFNQETFRGDEHEAARILDACATLPFGAERKCVTVARAEKLKADSRSQLAEYCAAPNPSTTLILLWNDRPNPPNLGQETIQAAAKSGTVVKCWRPFENQRPQWIGQQLAKLGKKIHPEAARLLSDEGGESLAELKSEIEKLMLYTAGRPEISLADVRAAMSFRREQSIWKALDALDNRNYREAGRILGDCLEQGEEPVMLLSLVSRNLRLAAKNEAGDRGKRKTARVFRLLKQVDVALKSGQGIESAAFERLLDSLGAEEK